MKASPQAEQEMLARIFQSARRRVYRPDIRIIFQGRVGRLNNGEIKWEGETFHGFYWFIWSFYTDLRHAPANAPESVIFISRTGERYTYQDLENADVDFFSLASIERYLDSIETCRQGYTRF